MRAVGTCNIGLLLHKGILSSILRDTSVTLFLCTGNWSTYMYNALSFMCMLFPGIRKSLSGRGGKGGGGGGGVMHPGSPSCGFIFLENHLYQHSLEGLLSHLCIQGLLYFQQVPSIC